MTTTDYPTPEQIERLMSLHEKLGNRPARYRHRIIEAVSLSGRMTRTGIEIEIARLEDSVETHERNARRYGR
jgi:hypothetical protein